jgi:hypothetical protein
VHDVGVEVEGIGADAVPRNCRKKVSVNEGFLTDRAVDAPTIIS